MIFIFDWGHETRSVIGPLSKAEVSIEIPGDFIDLVKVKSWFRLFFIPTIPTSTRYYLADFEIRQRFEISKDDFEKLEPFAELNLKVVNNEISQSEYDSQYAKLQKN